MNGSFQNSAPHLSCRKRVAAIQAPPTAHRPAHRLAEEGHRGCDNEDGEMRSGGAAAEEAALAWFFLMEDWSRSRHLSFALLSCLQSLARTPTHHPSAVAPSPFPPAPFTLGLLCFPRHLSSSKSEIQARKCDTAGRQRPGGMERPGTPQAPGPPRRTGL